jgi:hypothetical protein
MFFLGKHHPLLAYHWITKTIRWRQKPNISARDKDTELLVYAHPHSNSSVHGLTLREAMWTVRDAKASKSTPFGLWEDGVRLGPTYPVCMLASRCRYFGGLLGVKGRICALVAGPVQYLGPVKDVTMLCVLGPVCFNALKFNSHHINVPSNAWSTKYRLIACMSAQIRSNLRDEYIKPN